MNIQWEQWVTFAVIVAIVVGAVMYVRRKS